MARIEHLSEQALLDGIIPALTQHADVELGPGDDAAVVCLDSPRLVVSTDTLTEGVDFLLHATTGEHIGRKAAVQNLADIAAMGARPHAVVVALSAPAGTESSLLEAVARGLAARCEQDGVSVVGGDLGKADHLSVTVTAMGTLPADQDPIRRDGAHVGDLVAVGSEQLGRSAAGLAWILAGRGDAPAAAALANWHNAPDPDLRLGWVAAPGAAHAMIDLSDGLVRDGGRLARASDVVIDLDRAVLDADVRTLTGSARAVTGEGVGDPDALAWQWVLHGGEEHALLATFPPGRLPRGFRVIGRVRARATGEPPRVTRNGEGIVGEGFDHFA